LLCILDSRLRGNDRYYHMLNISLVSETPDASQFTRSHSGKPMTGKPFDYPLDYYESSE